MNYLYRTGNGRTDIQFTGVYNALNFINVDPWLSRDSNTTLENSLQWFDFGSVPDLKLYRIGTGRNNIAWAKPIGWSDSGIGVIFRIITISQIDTENPYFLIENNHWYLSLNTDGLYEGNLYCKSVNGGTSYGDYAIELNEYTIIFNHDYISNNNTIDDREYEIKSIIDNSIKVRGSDNIDINFIGSSVKVQRTYTSIRLYQNLGQYITNTNNKFLLNNYNY